MIVIIGVVEYQQPQVRDPARAHKSEYAIESLHNFPSFGDDSTYAVTGGAFETV